MSHVVGAFVVGLAFASVTVACGSRSALLDGEPARGAIDASCTSRDAAPRPPDARAASGTCTVGDTFDIVRREGPLAHPRLARAGDRALLLFTQQHADAPHEIESVPIDLRGAVRGDVARVGPGRGGTLVGRTLDDTAPGFTASYAADDEMLYGARFDSDGRLVDRRALGFAGHGLRTLLVLTSRLAANGWNPIDPTAVATAFVQDLCTFESTPLALAARDPVGAATRREDAFRVAVHDGARAVATTFDASGRRLGETIHVLPETTFPVSTSLVRLAEGADDAVVLGGGTVRALQDALVSVELGAQSHLFFLPNDWLYDADAAYDPTTGWLAVAAGVDHDEGIGRASSPFVFFFGVTRDGRTAELVVAGPVSAATYVHPAILWTGLPEAPFLVVWQDAGSTTMRGASVDCD